MILILEARFYDDLADMALNAAKKTLEDEGEAYEVVTVPGALEIPAALSLAVKSGRYNAYVLLGAVIRGETTHYDVVCDNAMRGIYRLVLDHDLALGNGIQTCESKDQVLQRFDPAQKDKAGGAARAALHMLRLKRDLAE